jgi:hypothetical protein
MMKLILESQVVNCDGGKQNTTRQIRFYRGFSLFLIINMSSSVETFHTHCGFHNVVLGIYFSVAISLLNMMVYRGARGENKANTCEIYKQCFLITVVAFMVF